MHVNKSFKKNRQRSDPPPILPMPDFGNIWSGYPSLKGHSPKKGKMWEVLRGGGVPKVLKLKINEYLMESTGEATLLPPLQGQLQPSQDVGNCYGVAKHRRGGDCCYSGARQGQLRHLHLWWDRGVELEKVLAQPRGGDEVLEVRHMFQRLSFLHMRGNANLLVHHVPAGEVVDATVDGID